jgi:hypothetical protein
MKMSFRRKENSMKKIVKLVIVGLAAYGGYCLYVSNQTSINKAETKVKDVWAAAKK